MRWQDFGSSGNFEDRRGMGGGLVRGGGLGIGAILVLTLIGWVTGINPAILIGGAEMVTGGGSGYEQSAPQGRTGPPQDEMGRFVSAILKNTEDVWNQVLPQQVNREYNEPRLVVFSGTTSTGGRGVRGCGIAQSAMGPFYCPLDKTVYLDTDFFADMQRRFGAGGDFAYAYVIAHEVGHHVENELGLLARVQQRQQEVGQTEANRLSVRVELMADCLAGVWAFHSNQRWQSLQEGDVEEAMRAAAAIGDDRLQKQSGGRVVPDSFTHGSSEQRTRWFMTGLRSGQVQSCDTFRTNRL